MKISITLLKEKLLKQAFSLLLVVVLAFSQPAAAVVYAEETLPEAPPQEQSSETSTPPAESQSQETPPADTSSVEPPPEVSPTPTPEADIQNSAEVNNNVDSSAQTGDNTINTPTPTPTEEAVPPAEETAVQESAETDETPTPAEAPPAESTASETPPEESSPESTPSAEIQTSDAISLTQMDNQVNTTSVNSSVLNQTLNIYGNETTTLDLSQLVSSVFPAIFTGEHANDNTINVALGVNNSFTYLTNDVISEANTGGNNIAGGDSAAITSGNAFSLVSIFNNVNTTIVDSVLRLITINIFGVLVGNIILPEYDGSTTPCCGGSVSIDNQAAVDNNVTSAAVSGENSITASTSGQIDTGTAQSSVNIVNLVNQSFLDSSIQLLWINVLGSWNGTFRGWNAFGEVPGGDSLSFQSLTTGATADSGCPTCLHAVDIENMAYVTNNINSLANTGGNSIGADRATITTGNAYSVVNLINLVNTSFIRSLGFFGFINIFGALEGDIGGVSRFPTPTPEPEAAQAESPNPGNQGDGPRESGGQLEITQSNNTGTHVLPGDTVTFFITIRNPGSGRVYDSQLYLGLFRDGVDTGGILYPLGTIKPFGTVKVTTGLVLSPQAQPGHYTARAIVTGHVGPENNTISASADSSLLIAGFSPAVPQIVLGSEAQAAEGGETLGQQAGLTRAKREEQLKRLLLILALMYAGIQGVRRRRELTLAMYQYSLRMFL